ncbi:MAG: GGDEF domain-containing protein [Acidobacteriota bacterium]
MDKLKEERETAIHNDLQQSELVNTRLLKDVGIESVLGLLENCPIKKLKAGEILISAGQRNHTVYFLLSGRVQIHLKLHMQPIATLEAGETVGEISVIDGRVTTANVVAEVDSRVLELDEPTFWSLVDASAGVAQNLMYMLANRLRHGDSLISTGQEFQLEYARYTILDAVTGLHNRRWFDVMLSKQMNRCKQGDMCLSLLLVGIDYFKRYNTTHGRVSGDRALHTVAWTLRGSLRPGELMARYAGEKFVVLLPSTDVENARPPAERLSQAIGESKIHSLDRKLLPSISASIGIAQMTSEDTETSFVAVARRALRDAQKKGGNRVSFGPEG